MHKKYKPTPKFNSNLYTVFFSKTTTDLMRTYIISELTDCSHAGMPAIVKTQLIINY